MTAPTGATAERTRMRHEDWVAAATEEYRRLIALLLGLEEPAWTAQTDCAEWDVRDMVAHLVGAGEGTASVPEAVRQLRLGRKARRPGDMLVDGINIVQIAERADRTPVRLVADLADVAVRGVAARKKLPAAIRALRVPFGPPLGVKSVGYLMDRIYTRDAWMHRIDICRATGQPAEVTPAHDGRLVDDVASEWAKAHGKPFRLTLTGPAGGVWSAGEDGEQIELDAIEFCRLMAGRGTGQGLLATQVPF